MTPTYTLTGIVQDNAPKLFSPTEITITSSRRLTPGSARAAGDRLEVQGDEVVRVELENGFILYSRADDLLRDRGREVSNRDGEKTWEIDLRPARGVQRGERGWLGLGIKVLNFFGVDLQEQAAKTLGAKAEAKLLRGNTPGLYRCDLGDRFALAPVAAGALAAGGQEPLLVFLHGTASSCEGSFGKLWQGKAGQVARQAMKGRYGDRVFALEHHTLTQSPIQNALDLVETLPDGARLHLVSHSRGGLVGELLCLGQRDRKNDPLGHGYIDTLFEADRTLARDLGLPPLSIVEADARSDAYKNDRDRLKQLLSELDRKRITVQRFVRVACPARGTTLASGRLDRWLSVLNHLAGEGLLGDMVDFLLAVVKQRTDPRVLPGLEAMMPGSALTRLLNHPELVTSADLAVIAGDIEGDGLWGQIKLLAADWFYGADHDLVVNTGSMYGGLRRADKGARFLFDQGAEVNHFHYFSNDRSVRWLVNGLTRNDDSDGGFQPLAAARHEAPKWRGAVQRSREISTPRPLAVMLPGTMGSALQADGDAIWLEYGALFKGGLGRLRLGQAREVIPTDLLDDFYGPLLEFLARTHRVEIHPYDWRLSVRAAAEKLTARLEAWLPDLERQGQPVHLVAHSMGGLVVRAMIADGGRGSAVWRRIRKLPNSRFMMLGTPNLGSHEAVRWLTGHNPTQAKLSLLDFSHGTDEIIGIVNTFPGLLELLPFDPAGEDFSQPALWRNLKTALDEDWPLCDAGTLAQARATWDFLRKAPPDPEHMIYVAGCQPATVVGYEVVEDGWGWFGEKKQLEFLATPEGDGTVSWKSGLLPGLKAWYVENTAHDELCCQKKAFPAYLDLLMSGDTQRLPAAPPQTREAKGAPERFRLPVSPPADGIPEQGNLREFGFGIGRPFNAAAAGEGVPVVRVSLRHGNLAYARHPVMVGHYLGDTIISAESALDDRLSGVLKERLRLGLYPGRMGTHALFFNDKPDGKPVGAIVLGLGQVGELNPGLLHKGVRDALLDYALRIAQWPDDRFGPADRVRTAPVSCLLVGSGAGGISVRDSVEAILRGVVDANAKLVDVQMEDRVVIDQVEFLELYTDVALGAADALDTALRDGELAMKVSWEDRTLQPGEGSLNRVRCDDPPAWWQRLEIIEEKRADALRFIATTDRARAEITLATGQLRLAENFIRQASQSAKSNSEVAKTLFEMLLPNRLKELAPHQSNVVLLVDEVSARFPWELLEDRWSHDNRPLSVAAGMVRQFKTARFRPHPAHASEDTAFVVGNPDLEGWSEFSDLPGARKEAETVTALLNNQGFHALDCIDARADDILAGLHRKPWRILHLAGHGDHEFKPGDGQASERPYSGMVIGKNTFLTPGDVEQMRWAPELVFINCCHLGKTQHGAAAHGLLGDLAANLAAQFVEMGVKAVVAAGWAVDDGAAEAFAASFYTHMLEGRGFGDAVRAAREETWVRFPEANTWGAYQCYGDPGYRLIERKDDHGHAEPKPYRAPQELVADLNNYREEIRMRTRDSQDDPGELDRLRDGIADRLKRIPADAEAAWRQRGDVCAAIGFAWGETSAFDEAVEWLEKAMRAETGDCPVRAVEQCANFRVRRAAERWQALRADAGNRAIEEKRHELVADIDRSLHELDLINQRAQSQERLNLLGSACKRLAWMQDDPAPRLEALVNMANYYRLAYDEGRRKNKVDAYPFTNWAVAEIFAGLLDPARKKELSTLEAECQTILQITQDRLNHKPTFWDASGMADCELVLLLLANDAQPDAAQQQAMRIAERYRAAGQRGASPREYASVREHLEFVAAMTQALGSPIAAALDNLRAAL